MSWNVPKCLENLANPLQAPRMKRQMPVQAKQNDYGKTYILPRHEVRQGGSSSSVQATPPERVLHIYLGKSLCLTLFSLYLLYSLWMKMICVVLLNWFDENVFIKVIVSNCILNNYKGFTNHFWQLYLYFKCIMRVVSHKCIKTNRIDKKYICTFAL